MKSKVNLFLIVLILCFKLYETLPSFGNEFVHIKVHLPVGCGDTHVHAHGVPKHAHAPVISSPHIHAHAIVHAPVISSPHKVIHHFHHKRRRPAKKTPSFGKHSGLLESILLSEIKKPIGSSHYKYLSHAEDIAKPHIENYKLIEETKPKQTVETFKVIKKKIPYRHQGHHHYPTETLDERYHYNSTKPIETYKVIDSLIGDYHTHVKDVGYQYLPSKKKERFETVKIIDSHEHKPVAFDDYISQDYATHDDSHIYAGNSQSETVEIPQQKTPLKSSSYYNRHRQHNQHVDDIHKSHDYPYELSSKTTNYDDEDDDDDVYTAGYEYKAPNYEGNYRTISDEHYTQEPSEDSYLLAKLPSTYHQSHQQNLLYNDEAQSISSPTDIDLPPPPLLLELDGDSTSETTSHWSVHDNGSKATKTYSGIGSYSAAHVQGLDSGGYQYPSTFL